MPPGSPPRCHPSSAADGRPSCSVATAASTLAASARSTSSSSARRVTNAVAAPITTTRRATSPRVRTNRRRRVCEIRREVGLGHPTGHVIGAQGVPDATDRSEPVRPLQLPELAAEVVDVQVHHVRVDVGLRAPDGIEDLVPGDHLAGVADQVPEERVLARRQVDRPVADLGGMAKLVEFEVAAASEARSCRPAGRRPRARIRATSSANENGFGR